VDAAIAAGVPDPNNLLSPAVRAAASYQLDHR
jgi:hypothetical protein